MFKLYTLKGEGLGFKSFYLLLPTRGDEKREIPIMYYLYPLATNDFTCLINELQLTSYKRLLQCTLIQWRISIFP